MIQPVDDTARRIDVYCVDLKIHFIQKGNRT